MMNVEEIGPNFWQVTEGDSDPNPGQIHRVALSANDNSAEAAIAVVMQGYAPTPPLGQIDQDLQMARARTAAKLLMQAWIEALLSQITGPIPLDEKLSWGQKADAARAVMAGAATADHLAILAPEADLRGISVAELALRVTAKATVYTLVVAKAAGLRDVVWDGIAQAMSDAEIDAVLANARLTAQAMAAELGVAV